MNPWIERYGREQNILGDDVAGLTATELDARPQEGKWSIRELVWHVADTDFIMADRVRRVIAEERPTLMGFDQNAFFQRLSYGTLDIVPAIALWSANRRALEMVLQRVTENDLARVGVHSEAGELTLLDLLKKCSNHYAHHRQFLLEKRRLLGKPLSE